MASYEARKRAIEKASKRASTGSIWVRRALDAGDLVRKREQPARCPSCESDDPELRWFVVYDDDDYIGGWGDDDWLAGVVGRGRDRAIYRCPDPFHNPQEALK